MGQYLIDTNVVSDYFSASFSDVGMEFMDAVIDAVPNISVITQIELLCFAGKLMRLPSKTSKISLLIALSWTLAPMLSLNASTSAKAKK
jgi:hypothetical protein